MDRLNGVIADLRDQISSMRGDAESAKRAKSAAEEKLAQMSDRLKVPTTHHFMYWCQLRHFLWPT